MKKITLFFTLLLATVIASAQVNFTVEGFKIKAGETKPMVINMEANVGIKALEFLMHMPEGLEVVYPSNNILTMSDRAKVITAYADEWETNLCHITAYSPTDVAVAAGSGPLMQIDIKAAKDASLVHLFEMDAF